MGGAWGAVDPDPDPDPSRGARGLIGGDGLRWVGVLPPRLRLVGVGLSPCCQRAYRQGLSIVARVLPNSFGLVVPVLVVQILAGLTLD